MYSSNVFTCLIHATQWTGITQVARGFLHSGCWTRISPLLFFGVLWMLRCFCVLGWSVTENSILHTYIHIHSCRPSHEQTHQNSNLTWSEGGGDELSEQAMTQWFLLKITVYFSVCPSGSLTRTPFIATKLCVCVCVFEWVSEYVSQRLPVCVTLDSRIYMCV